MLPRLLLIALMLAFSPVLPAVAQVKNVDWSIYEVKDAQGRDRAYKDAVLSAKRDAVDKAVYGLFAQTEEERARYREQRESILLGLPAYLKDFEVVNKSREGDSVILEASATINRAPLKAKLLELGIVKELAETLSASEQPRVLAVMSWNSEDPGLSGFALGRINDYLSKQQLELVDHATIRELLADDDTLASREVATSSDLAVRSQADVYLMVSAAVRPTRNFGNTSLYQASVTIEARAPFADAPIEVHAYQSRELTFATQGEHEKSKRAAIEEAIGGAIEPLSQTILKTWKEAKAQGRPYRIRYRGGSPTAQALLASRLKSQATLVKQEQGQGEVAFTVRYPGALEGLLEQLVSLPEAELRVESEAGSEAVLR